MALCIALAQIFLVEWAFKLESRILNFDKSLWNLKDFLNIFVPNFYENLRTQSDMPTLISKDIMK